ncbi:MAG TPA: aryl-sulfate sulfotransferase [Flavilitoribacter sp.]|nr:aryl-sulfate sulfotransferase [Flavilitoribacter sp.]
MKKRLLSATLFLMAAALTAQNTVGLLSYQPQQAFDGYNLIFPHNQSTVYLLDNCGEIVNSWTSAADLRPGNKVALLPDGRLVVAIRPDDVSNDPIWAGGGGATIEIRDWDNNVEWSYTLNNAERRLHHSFVVKPDGNLILIAWEKKTREEAIQAGRDSTLLPQNEIWPDYLFEINPANDSIVWEWHTWDHLIQDFDATKDNYGVIADHPELIDFNYDTSNGNPDWMHGNAVDYNPDLDQVLFGVPTFSEIWIIDRSTTTEEATGHSGGASGKGGDLMFRWGNPAVYGVAAPQTLFFQHNAHWITDVDIFDPNYGKIAVFNNRYGANYSVANIIANTFDMYKGNYPMSDGAFLPTTYDETIKHPVDSTLMNSNGLSSIQYLPNGNYLIQVGRTGYAFELTPDQEIVWEYKVPLKNGQPAPQGATLVANDNITFEMIRYPAGFPGFDGKDLSGKGWIETSPDSTFCSNILPTEDVADHARLKVYPNPAFDWVTLEWDNAGPIAVEVLDLTGKPVMGTRKLESGKADLDVSGLPRGMYFLWVNGVRARKLLVVK